MEASASVEILDDFEQSCHEVRLFMEGKTELKTLKEALNEIRN